MRSTSETRATPTRGVRRRTDDHGAAMVEFALVAPIMLLLIFGIIEFGWLFAQHLDVRHGAREASRIAAVNFSSTDPAATGTAQSTQIRDEMCTRMDFAEDTELELLILGATAEKGDLGEVVVTAEPRQITGVFSPIIDSIDLTSSVEFRIETDTTWAAGDAGTCP